jgi:branched-subunit amino acid permease
MRDIINFILAVFCVKLVEDNLPNLHYKKLIAFFAPVLLLVYILFLAVVVKIINSPQQKKTLLTLMTLVAVSIILAKNIEQQKKQTIS